MENHKLIKTDETRRVNSIRQLARFQVLTFHRALRLKKFRRLGFSQRTAHPYEHAHSSDFSPLGSITLLIVRQEKFLDQLVCHGQGALDIASCI